MACVAMGIFISGCAACGGSPGTAMGTAEASEQVGSSAVAGASDANGAAASLAVSIAQ